MSTPEQKPQRPPWADRASQWADEYVRKWALTLWTLGAGGGGLGVGLVVGGAASPDWVEAAGTWAGVFVGAGVGIVAYRAFIHQSYESTMSRHTALVQRQEDFEQRQRQQAADASQITADVAFHEGYNLGLVDGTKKGGATSVTVGVSNQAAAVATDLEITVHRLDGEESFTAAFDRLHGYSDDSRQVDVDPALTMSETADGGDVGEIVVEFSMHGSRWEKAGDNPATPIA